MHKDFYASGFLYHPSSQQILLQQVNSDDESPSWSLLSDVGAIDKAGEEIFKDLSYKQLKLKLNIKHIHLIYTYFSSETNKNHNIYYAEVKKVHKFPVSKKTNFGWFTFKQIGKLNLLKQTKQDIIIGQRVIQSAVRKVLGERTIE